MSQHPDASNEEKARRHTLFYSLSLLGILVVLLGGVSLLPTSTMRGERGLAWTRSKESVLLHRDNSGEGATATGIYRSKQISRFEHSRQKSMHVHSRPESMFERLWQGYILHMARM